MSKRLSRKTFQERFDVLLATLREDIIAGKFPAGSLLPSEVSLSEQFQLSGKSVSRVLDTLEEEGLISKKHRVGSVVNLTSAAKTTLNFVFSQSLFRDIDLMSILSAFQRSYPHIAINPIMSNYPSSFTPEYVKADGIDVIVLSQNAFGGFIDQGECDLLEPVDVHKDTYPFLTSLFTVNETCYVTPLVFSPVVLCYNKDHFAELNIPEPDSNWTWDELRQLAFTLSKEGERFGFHFEMLALNRWPIFLLQDRVTWGDVQKGGQVGEEEIKSLLQFYRNLIGPQNITPAFLIQENPNIHRLFLQGKVSMAMMTYFGLNDLKRSSVRYDIAPLPYFSSPVTLLISYGIAINKYSPQKKEAKLFADYLASVQMQLYIKQNSLSIPAMKPIAESRQEGELYNRPFRYYLYREIIPTYRSHKDLGWDAKEVEHVQQSLRLHWHKQLSNEGLGT